MVQGVLFIWELGYLGRSGLGSNAGVHAQPHLSLNIWKLRIWSMMIWSTGRHLFVLLRPTLAIWRLNMAGVTYCMVELWNLSVVQQKCCTRCTGGARHLCASSGNFCSLKQSQVSLFSDHATKVWRLEVLPPHGLRIICGRLGCWVHLGGF